MIKIANVLVLLKGPAVEDCNMVVALRKNQESIEPQRYKCQAVRLILPACIDEEGGEGKRAH